MLFERKIFDIRNPNLRSDQKIRLISITFGIVTHHLNHRATNLCEIEKFQNFNTFQKHDGQI